MPTTFAASLLGDLGTLIALCVSAFVILLVAIWGQISLGNRALKMGQDMAFGAFAVFVWFIGVAQLISGRVGGLVLVLVTLLMATALIDPIRRATWGRVLPIGPDDRMHMLGLVCLLFAAAIFFLSSATVAAPVGANGEGSDQLAQIVPSGGLLFAAGQALVIAVLAVALVGVGVRLVPRLETARAELAGVGTGAGGRRGEARRGVIASSLDDAGGKREYGTRFRWRRTPDEIRERLGLVALTPGAILAGVLTAATLVGVTYAGRVLTAALAPDLAANVSRIAAQAQANIGGFAAAAIAAVLVAASEEIMFRGAIQPRFGILLTALAFAALHTQYGFGLAPLTALVVGLALGIARRLGSTTSTLIGHILFVVVMLALVATGVYAG